MLYLGRTALITGGSSGIGLEFARIFARRGANLVLVARSEERLRETAAALEEEYGVSVRTIPANLSEKDSVEKIVSGVEDLGLEVSLLVNNAGSGYYGGFSEGPEPEEVWDGLLVKVLGHDQLGPSLADVARIEVRAGGCAYCSPRPDPCIGPG